VLTHTTASGGVPAGRAASSPPLVDASGSPCTRFLDAGRFAACCGRSRWRPAGTGALRARADLLAASLLASAAVFVPGPGDVELLLAFGVPRGAMELGADAAAIAARATACAAPA
jgi:hypothetical protein